MKTAFLYTICLLLAISQLNCQRMVLKPEDGSEQMREFKLAMGQLLKNSTSKQNLKPAMEIPKAFYKAVGSLIDFKPKAPKFKKVTYKYKIKPNPSQKGKKIYKFKIKPNQIGKNGKISVKINGKKIKIPLPTGQNLKPGQKMKLKVKVKGNSVKAKLNGKKYYIKNVNNLSRTMFVKAAMKKAVKKFIKPAENFIEMIADHISNLFDEKKSEIDSEKQKEQFLKKAMVKLVKKVENLNFVKNLKSVKRALRKLAKGNDQDVSAVRRALLETLNESPKIEKNMKDDLTVLDEPNLTKVVQ